MSASSPKRRSRLRLGTLTYVWAEKGSRPAALRDQRRQSAYLFGAVCAERGVGAALVLPHANADAMSLHLTEISRHVAKGAHAVVVLDGAGWHQAGGRLQVPGNVSLLRLPPYSPELNPQENVWQYLRQNQLSNRVFTNCDAIVEACCTAWNALMALPDPPLSRCFSRRRPLDGCFLACLGSMVSGPHTGLLAPLATTK